MNTNVLYLVDKLKGHCRLHDLQHMVPFFSLCIIKGLVIFDIILEVKSIVEFGKYFFLIGNHIILDSYIGLQESTKRIKLRL